MASYLETLGLELSSATPVGKMRHAVLSGQEWSPDPTTSVSYVAANRVLLVMDESRGRTVETSLGERFLCYIAMQEEQDRTVIAANAWTTPGLQVEGYLGRFTATNAGMESTEAGEGGLGRMMGIPNGFFDHVIDGGDASLISADIKPPGYHHVGTDPDRLQEAIESVREMVGEFEKPRFFDYDPDICAHGSSGIEGCNRCLKACPTDAIISIGEKIEVNPHLCQGGGTCTARCPSGAISYRYPSMEMQVDFLRNLFREIRDSAGPKEITLLIYDSEHGDSSVTEVSHALPEHVIPFMVEEIGSLGPELLACAVAYGAGEIWIHVPRNVPEKIASGLEEAVLLIQAVLQHSGLGHVVLQTTASLDPVLEATSLERERVDVATFASVGGKRTLLRSAFCHLLQSGSQADPVPLPNGSLFGQVNLNVDACTLCMGCVSVCPANALEAGGDTPALRFVEGNCVQCGICTRACPESALQLDPRFNPTDTAIRARTLKEEEPFRCITCGKPFATQAMIDRMMSKLTGHWMFETPAQQNRLRMCEDCRVADMFDRKDMIG